MAEPPLAIGAAIAIVGIKAAVFRGRTGGGASRWVSFRERAVVMKKQTRLSLLILLTEIRTGDKGF